MANDAIATGPAGAAVALTARETMIWRFSSVSGFRRTTTASPTLRSPSVAGCALSVIVVERSGVTMKPVFSTNWLGATAAMVPMRDA